MSYDWDWLVLFRESITGEGLYGAMFLKGLGWTLLISLASWIVALALGIALGVGRTLPSRLVRWPVTAYVHCFRNTPLLVQLFLWYFVLPELLPPAWGDALKQMNSTLNQLLTVLLCLTLYTAAKAAEQVRAGIESVASGQRHAGKALGLTTLGLYRHVLLPQALRIVIPPLTSDFMNVFKNSAVALTIGLMELTGMSRQISEFSAHPFEAFTAATAAYMFITLAVVWLMRTIEARTRVPGLLGA
jgi:glutamate/aspartate transport system permease protein